jgi:hypothetical protein
MAKTLAGVLAVSIAALLFAGCGGSSTAGNSDADSAQILTQCATGYSEAAAKMNEAGATFSNEMLGSTADAAKRTFAAAYQVFNDEVSRIPCPDQVKADIRTLVEATSVAISQLNSMANGGQPDLAAVNASTARMSSASTLIRSALNLPPATRGL